MRRVCATQIRVSRSSRFSRSAALLRVVAIGGAIAASPAGAATFTAADLLPLQAGNSWTYTNDVPESGTVTVLSERRSVNGVSTWVLDSSGPHILSATEYFTNDASGLRVHGARIEFGFQLPTLELNPPLVLSPAVGTVGSVTPSAGTATVVVSGEGSYPVNYQASVHAVGNESLTVPAGSFSAMRFDLDFAANGQVQGQAVSISATESLWLAPGVGLVMERLTGLSQAASSHAPLRLGRALTANLNVNINIPVDPGPWRLQSYQVPEPAAAGWTGVASVAVLAVARSLFGARSSRGFAIAASK